MAPRRQTGTGETPPLPPVNPIVEGTTEAVRDMFVTALQAASADIEKLFAKNGDVPMSNVLQALTTGMVKLLAERVQAVAAPPKDPGKDPG